MNLLQELWSWLKSFGAAVAIALLIGIFICQPYRVEGHSMDPTLHDRQHIFVSKLPHTFSSVPEYGDIVIVDSRVNRPRSFFRDELLENPIITWVRGEENRSMYIKRLLGKPGDVLQLKDGVLIRNGAAVDEPYIKEAMIRTPDREWTVPEDHVFVMGDNRNNSLDSREIGFIPLDHVLGKKIP